MIAATIPEAYDPIGKQVSQPFLRRKGPRPTFPMGRYVSQPLTVKCQSIRDVRQFLADCKYVSDKKLFDKEDYWQPPEEFEQRKKGDCEDFSFWTWRQLMDMGYDARLVFGRHGRYGIGHAWVEYFNDGKCLLVEPLLSRVGDRFPTLSTLRYTPRFSISWDGTTLRYFAHKERPSTFAWRALLPLVWDYLRFWSWLWLRISYRLPRIAWNILRRGLLEGDLWHRPKRP